MDISLVKQREAFLKKAAALPSVEKRKAKPAEKEEKKSKKPKLKSEPSSAPLDYKVSQGSSQFKFSVLAKIVRFLKGRHQEDMNEPLILEEILNETKQLDITSKMKHWLATESLLNNPKVTVVKEDGVSKFMFKPKYEIRGKKGLVKLLRSHDLHGRGGIYKEEIEESLPDTDKILKAVQDHVITINRPQDKRQVLFYNDKLCRFSIDEDFKKLWRGVTVEGLDDAKIEEYLNKQGISSMDSNTIKKVSKVSLRKGKQKNRTFKRHNDHLQGVLQDYSGNPGENKTG